MTASLKQLLKLQIKVVAYSRNQLGLQCVFPCCIGGSTTHRTDLENLREIASQLDGQFAVYGRQPHLLDHRPEPLESLTAVLLVLDGLGEARDSVELGDGERGMQQRLLLGGILQLDHQPVLLGIRLLELGVERHGVGTIDDCVDQPLDLPLDTRECGLRAGLGRRQDHALPVGLCHESLGELLESRRLHQACLQACHDRGLQLVASDRQLVGAGAAVA